jgi:hypothetical protein
MHWVQIVGRGRDEDVVEVKSEKYQTRSDLFKALRPICGCARVGTLRLSFGLPLHIQYPQPQQPVLSALPTYRIVSGAL